MKRLVICYDGTWNAVTNPDEVTNVVRMAQAVKSVAEDGTTQVVYYNAGVGSGGPIDRFVGGVFGAGLRNNVKRGWRSCRSTGIPRSFPIVRWPTRSTSLASRAGPTAQPLPA
jgi:hypothetical protein